MLTLADVEGTTGLTAASLFAGIGGSSLGYRLAGFDVVYANEWDGAAAATYALNSTVVPDQRDIREVRGVDVGEVDVLDGSPPCQDFSTVGSRDPEGERAMLYYEFVRLVGEVRPLAFAAENVLGFVQGAMRARHFLPILAALRGKGYRVEARTLDASWLGVPQARKRVILLGLREDQGADPRFPRKHKQQTAIRDVLPAVTRIMRPAGRVRWFATDGNFAYDRIECSTPKKYKWCDETIWPASGPAPTITCSGMGASGAEGIVIETRDGQQLPPSVAQLKALCGFPRDFQFAEGAEPWRQLGNSVLPPMARAWAEEFARILGRRSAHTFTPAADVDRCRRG